MEALFHLSRVVQCLDERDAPLTRPVGVTVTVSCELPHLGVSLRQMMRGLETWAETHMDNVCANRATYDTRVG